MSNITTKDGTQIYYKDWGTGQPVVFSHWLSGAASHIPPTNPQPTAVAAAKGASSPQR